MSNALEPHDYTQGLPRFLERFWGTFGCLGIGMYVLNVFWGDPELWAYALGFLSAGYLALIWSALIAEDHERFRQGDFWRCAALFSFTLTPWLLFIPFWRPLTTIAGLISVTPVVLLSACAAFWLVSSKTRLRTIGARVRILKAAAVFWCLAAAVIGLLWPIVAPAGGWRVASLIVGVPSALFSLWLAQRFWTRPAEPYRHRISLSPASPAAD